MSMIERILNKNWDDYKKDLFPKNRKMRILRENKIDCMSSENIQFMVNEIVKEFASSGVYLEVGIYRGCSLLSAALFNKNTRCIGIDNFSQFKDLSVSKFFDTGFPTDYKNNEEVLKSNLLKFGNPENIEYYRMDYKEAISMLFSKEPDLKVDVYFYDGGHSYETQIEGLRIILPYLAKKSVILVDDINWGFVEKANEDFINENPEFNSEFKIKTKRNLSSDWWNGFEILARGD